MQEIAEEECALRAEMAELAQGLESVATEAGFPPTTGNMSGGEWRKWKNAGYKPGARRRRQMMFPQNHRP
jgi:hypothetical protein